MKADRPQPDARATRAIAAGLVGCVLVGVAWMGCSVDRNYETLSFFFDGVPDPKAKEAAARAAGVTEDIRKSPTYSLHKPFAEEQCFECHKGQLTMTGRESGMCLSCHKEQTSNHARMHGPVAAGACLWCHNPHESAEAHLMRKPARQVCMQCHDKKLLDAETVPEHGDESRSCLECHSGHGGKAPMFLKEGYSRVAPAAVEPPRPP